MRNFLELLALPSSLLLLIVTSPSPTQSSKLSWPYNLDPNTKYYPSEESEIKKNAELRKRLEVENPIEVKKMSGDEGEMFFLGYWGFGGDSTEQKNEASSRLRPRLSHGEWEDGSSPQEGGNASMLLAYQPAFLPHSDDVWPRNALFARLFHPRALSLSRRGYQCPTDTHNCSSIDRPNACCVTGETCEIITDTGLGDVGCCADGKSCSGKVSTCEDGYTECSSSQGGGCCLPGYACVGVGCAITSTATVVVTPTVTASASATTTTGAGATTTTKSTSTTPTTTAAATTTTTTASLTCSTGFRSCPASLGGGCCPTSRGCASASCPALTTTTTLSSSTTSSTSGENPAAPVRPTSIDTLTTTNSALSSASSCPTGYYVCSAFYPIGRCCRVGRDCASTSCPAYTTETVETRTGTNGVTIVVVGTGSAASTITGTGTSATATGSSCADGWALCPSSVGGGCCPTGFGCGTSSCTISSTDVTATVAKETASPNAAAATITPRMGLGVGAGMLGAGLLVLA
ncbi:MAG: hypothetical protein M1834_001923 [Cirrosporium novae-zelandiae]|nr:MAG: hypothetical protein M1834_001923 [Cirrosporium novae-zelandiae]